MYLPSRPTGRRREQRTRNGSRKILSFAFIRVNGRSFLRLLCLLLYTFSSLHSVPGTCLSPSFLLSLSVTTFLSFVSTGSLTPFHNSSSLVMLAEPNARRCQRVPVCRVSLFLRPVIMNIRDFRSFSRSFLSFSPFFFILVLVVVLLDVVLSFGYSPSTPSVILAARCRRAAV